MKKTAIILSILAFIASGCGQRPSAESNENTERTTTDDQDSTELCQTTPPDFKTLKLDFDFLVTVGKEEDFKSFKTYTYFKLERDNDIVYLDDSLTEYEFGDKLFPIILRTGDNDFELLFEINNRPFKNYLKRLFVSNNKLVGQDELPTFEAKPRDINNDGVMKYAGYWNSSETWGENYTLTGYSPILYYSVTETGLKLDSLLTKQRNEVIYGQFYGFSFNQKCEQPISVLDKFYQELKIIRND